MMNIQELYSYFRKLKILKGKYLNFDFLGDKMEFVIEPIPIEPILKRYMDGGTLRQFTFLFGSKENYSADAINQIQNSQWYIDFTELIENNNDMGILPNIEGIQTIEVLNSGTISETNVKDARYGIQMRITYIKGGN